MDRALKKALKDMFDELEKIDITEDPNEDGLLENFNNFLDSLWQIEGEWKMQEAFVARELHEGIDEEGVKPILH